MRETLRVGLEGTSVVRISRVGGLLEELKLLEMPKRSFMPDAVLVWYADGCAGKWTKIKTQSK